MQKIEDKKPVGEKSQRRKSNILRANSTSEGYNLKPTTSKMDMLSNDDEKHSEI